MVTDQEKTEQQKKEQSDQDPLEEQLIDIQSLAEEVFHLLKKELQLENERRGR